MNFYKISIAIVIFVISFSCNTEKKDAIIKVKKEELVMYQPSETTLLMREMFDFNLESKKRIEKGELPQDFPEKFLKIHSSKLSSNFERDESFKNFTKLFFSNIENLDKSNQQNVKENFNLAINTCIACHTTTCTGPISRIKKLRIN
jgi:hypothetical protein